MVLDCLAEEQLWCMMTLYATGVEPGSAIPFNNDSNKGMKLILAKLTLHLIGSDLKQEKRANILGNSVRVLQKNFLPLFLLLLLTTALRAQPQHTTMYCRGGLFPGAVLTMTYIELPNGTSKDYIWISPVQSASGNGNYNFSFNISKTTSNAGQYWGANNATVTVNSPLVYPVSTADGHWEVQSGRKYIFTLKDVPNNTNSGGFVFEFSGTPAVITGVTNTIAMENAPVTVTATLDAVPVPGQSIYCRWSKDQNFASSSLIKFSGSGSSLTVAIPGQPGSTRVYYYCFTSGSGELTTANCNMATIGSTAIKNYTVNGTTPTLLFNPDTLDGFSYGYNYGPSESKSFEITGYLLTGYPGNIMVTPSAGMEVSNNDSVFSANPLMIPYNGASLAAVKIYVRLKAGLELGTYNTERITCSGGGASDTYVACKGKVTSSDPVLSVSNSLLSGFVSVQNGVPSTSQHFTLQGHYLQGGSGVVSLIPSGGYEISLDNTVFKDSIVSVAYSSPTLNPVTVYIRLKSSLTAGVYNSGTVVISGGGATALTVSCSGKVLPPGTQNLGNWWNDQVFYEIFVRSFSDGNGNGIGDFAGLMQKLDYLKSANPQATTDLGVTAIWLMPIMQSPSYHGYDVTDYKTIEQDFGNNAQFKTFLDSAHAHGIKVIIDLVINHTSDQHPWFVNSKSSAASPYRNWYVWSPTNPGFNGPWGQQVWYNSGGNYYYGVFTGSMPDLNYFNPSVKSEIFTIADYWLDSVKVDGFRLDAAKYICEEGSVLQDAPSTLAFWRDFRNHCKGENPNSMTVGEVWSNTSAVLPYVDGTGLDICFEFETAGDIISSINSGNPASLRTQMNTVVTKKYPALQYATFLTNHDQMRVMSQLNNNPANAKLAAALLLTLPGVPFLYYGEEIGMTSGSDDPSKRTPMQWTNGTNAGFTTGTPWKAVSSNYTTNNVLTMSADTNSLFNWYKKLLHLREASNALRRGEYIPLSGPATSIYAFGRRYAENANDMVFVLHNFSSVNISNPPVSCSAAEYRGARPGTYILFDQISKKPAGECIVHTDGAIVITTTLELAAKSTAILQADYQSAISEEDNNNCRSTFQLHQNYPNPFNPSTMISYSLSQETIVELSVYNILGQKIRILENSRKAPGTYQVRFDAANLESGVYFYTLSAGSFKKTQKMIFVK